MENDKELGVGEGDEWKRYSRYYIRARGALPPRAGTCWRDKHTHTLTFGECPIMRQMTNRDDMRSFVLKVGCFLK